MLLLLFCCCCCCCCPVHGVVVVLWWSLVVRVVAAVVYPVVVWCCWTHDLVFGSPNDVFFRSIVVVVDIVVVVMHMLLLMIMCLFIQCYWFFPVFFYFVPFTFSTFCIFLASFVFLVENLRWTSRFIYRWSFCVQLMSIFNICNITPFYSLLRVVRPRPPQVVPLTAPFLICNIMLMVKLTKVLVVFHVFFFIWCFHCYNTAGNVCLWCYYCTRPPLGSNCPYWLLWQLVSSLS